MALCGCREELQRCSAQPLLAGAAQTSSFIVIASRWIRWFAQQVDLYSHVRRTCTGK